MLQCSEISYENAHSFADFLKYFKKTHNYGSYYEYADETLAQGLSHLSQRVNNYDISDETKNSVDKLNEMRRLHL